MLIRTNVVVAIVSLVAAGISAFFAFHISRLDEIQDLRFAVATLREHVPDTYKEEIKSLSVSALPTDLAKTGDLEATKNDIPKIVEAEISGKLPGYIDSYYNENRHKFATEFQITTLRNQLARMASRVSTLDAESGMAYLGEVRCDEPPREFPVPGSEYSADARTDNWILFGINPLITSAVEGTNKRNAANAIYEFATVVESTPDRRAWKVELRVLLNYNTGAVKVYKIGNCNRSISGALFPGPPSTIQLVAVRRREKT